MTEKKDREVRVTFAEGVRGDVTSLVSQSVEGEQADAPDVEALKRRVAKLLVECRDNPYIGELMWSGSAFADGRGL